MHIKPTAIDGEKARDEVIGLLKTYNKQFVFAPDSIHFGQFEKYEFDGYWSKFGTQNILGAVAKLPSLPSLFVGINYDLNENTLLVTISDRQKNVKKTKVAPKINLVILELTDVFTKHYGDNKVSIVRSNGVDGLGSKLGKRLWGHS